MADTCHRCRFWQVATSDEYGGEEWTPGICRREPPRMMDTRRCQRCDIACAVIVGEIHDLESEIDAAAAARFGSRAFVIAEAGHA